MVYYIVPLKMLFISRLIISNFKCFPSTELDKAKEILRDYC